jgi:hypothetical protein
MNHNGYEPANILKQEISRLTLLSQILSVAVILLGIVVALGTAKGAYSGKLFYGPRVANLKPKLVDGGIKLECL